jgi:Leucine-rich repeat (LRR) protein
LNTLSEGTYPHDKLELTNLELENPPLQAHLLSDLRSEMSDVQQEDLDQDTFFDDEAPYIPTFRKFNDQDLIDLCTALEKCPQVKHLDLSMNWEIGMHPSEGMSLLARSPFLKSLVLYRMGLTDEHLLSFQWNASLKSLDVSFNDLSDDIAEILSQMPLEELCLRGNSITHVGAQSLSQSKTLKDLDLSANYLFNEGAACFAKSTIEVLNLRENGITDAGAMALANTLVKTLLLGNDKRNWDCDPADESVDRNYDDDDDGDIFFNLIGDNGAEALAKNPYIEELCLEQNNRISDRGAVAFGKNSTLKELNLSFNIVGNEGAIALARTSSIRALDLSFNKGIQYWAFLHFALNAHIEKLNISQYFDPENVCKNSEGLIFDGDYLAYAFSVENDVLRELGLSGLGITDKGAYFLAKPKKLSYLYDLDIRYSDVSSDVELMFANTPNLISLGYRGYSDFIYSKLLDARLSLNEGLGQRAARLCLFSKIGSASQKTGIPYERALCKDIFEMSGNRPISDEERMQLKNKFDECVEDKARKGCLLYPV